MEWRGSALSDAASGRASGTVPRQDLTNDGGSIFFDRHPTPAILCEIGTGRILAGNHAMTLGYGYSREELSSMTVTDIQAADTHEGNIPDAAANSSGWGVVDGLGRYRAKDGTITDVEVRSEDVLFGGRKARL